MGRLIVDNDLIIKMNELYLQIGTYVGVSRALGGSPSASTVKKYIAVRFLRQRLQPIRQFACSMQEPLTALRYA